MKRKYGPKYVLQACICFLGKEFWLCHSLSSWLLLMNRLGRFCWSVKEPRRYTNCFSGQNARLSGILSDAPRIESWKSAMKRGGIDRSVSNVLQLRLESLLCWSPVHGVHLIFWRSWRPPFLISWRCCCCEVANVERLILILLFSHFRRNELGP